MLKYSKSPIDVSRVEDLKIFCEVQPAHTHCRHIYESSHIKVVDGFKDKSYKILVMSSRILSFLLLWKYNLNYLK